MPGLRPAGHRALRPAGARHHPPPDHRRPPHRDGARRDAVAALRRRPAGTPSPRCRPGSPSGSERIITVSQNSYDDICRTHGVSPEKLFVVPVGVDPDAVPPDPAASSASPHQIISTASADVAMKGQRYLLEALAKLRTEYPDLKLVMIGRLKEGSAAQRTIEPARPVGRGRVRLGRDRRAHRRAVQRVGLRRRAVAVRGLLAAGHRGDERPAARWSPPPAAPSPRSPARTARPAIAVGPATARRWPPASAGRSRIPTSAERIGAAGRERVIDRWSWRHTAVRTVEHYRALLAETLMRPGTIADADRRLRHASGSRRATWSSTWAPAPDDTPSSAPPGRRGRGARLLASTSCRRSGTCSGPWARPARSSPTALAACVHGDALRLPFADDTFDRIICSEVLEHIRDDAGAIAELTRVLQARRRASRSPCRRGCPRRSAGRCRPSTTRRWPPGGHVRIYTEELLRRASRRRRPRAGGLAPGPRPALARTGGCVARSARPTTRTRW